MRACLSLVALSLVLAGCSGHHAAPNRRSLTVLKHLTAEPANFGVILDAETGQAVAAFRVNNPIRAAIPDGKGGWYIGGGFIQDKHDCSDTKRYCEWQRRLTFKEYNKRRTDYADGLKTAELAVGANRSMETGEPVRL